MKTDVQTQLKDYWQGVYDAAPEIVEAEIRQPRPVPLAPTEGTFRPRPVWVAAVAAIAVLVLVGGTAWLLGGGATTEPADEPELILPLEFPLTELPPFQLEVRYQLDPAVTTGPDVAPEDSEVLMTVSYGGPDLLRIDVNRSVQLFPHESNGEPGPPHEAAGSYVIVNNDTIAEYAAAERWFFLSDRYAYFAPLDQLVWGTWEDICEFGEHEFLPATLVAGRETVRIRCSNARNSYELWVDAETGLMLRIVGGDIIVGNDIPGGLVLLSSGISVIEYEVLSITYEPQFADDLFSLSAPSGVIVEDIRGVDQSVGSEVLPSGSVVPELTGTYLSGGEFSLADLEGGRVALLFWASWCEPCLEAIDAMAVIAQERPDIAFVVVLIDDRVEDAAAVLEERQIHLPVVDPDGLSGDAYSEQWGPGIPSVVLIESDATVAVYHPGFGPLDLYQGIFKEAGW